MNKNVINDFLSTFPSQLLSLFVIFSNFFSFFLLQSNPPQMGHHYLFLFKEWFPIFLIITFILTFLGKSVLSMDQKFESCEPKDCGDGLIIRYPFWIPQEQQSYCGHPNFKITCISDKPILHLSNDDYVVQDIFYRNQSFLVANTGALDHTCPTPLHNFTLIGSPFKFSPYHADLFFFYNCTSVPNDHINYLHSCISNTNTSRQSFAMFSPEGGMEYLKASSEKCESLVGAPVDFDEGVTFKTFIGTDYTAMLKKGFLLEWTVSNCSKCEGSGGRCGFENNQFICFCRDRPYSQSCKNGGNNKVVKIGAGVGAGVVGALLMIVGIFVFYRRRRKQSLPTSMLVPKNISPDPSLKQDLEKGSTYFQTPIFTYTELEEATNNFDSSKELGDGGFGTVYYGKLRDGRVVAVKRLYENNFKRVEQFMNEIAILSRIRHQNLVSLYGCTSRHCRELLLVYEFIPNGTIADHLHGQRNKPGFLTWPIRMNIAIESADALAYLHASDIIHRDVKTNNILLDNSFHVKVADFGLSRLFPTDKTHVSTAPQGTPGYVDPEYYQCYQLTDRSDVYSFGVVLIELISSKPAVDVNRHRHDINLANMAITKIQNHALHELVDPHLGFESDYAIRMMITSVAELAFRCLQQEKEMRPSMMEILEVLRGIQSEEYKIEKADEVDIPSDDVGLLKNMPPPSPDSVTEQWTSSISTTPNISC